MPAARQLRGLLVNIARAGGDPEPVLRDIAQCCERLRRFPLSAPIATEAGASGVRRARAGRRLIYYLPMPTAIEIRAIRDGRQEFDPASLTLLP